MQTVLVTLITLVAFAANSVLCRWALMDQTIDPLSFSIVRILSGTLTLLILLTYLRSLNLTPNLNRIHITAVYRDTQSSNHSSN
ncbi:hypothetical protein EDB46_107193 [Vibrio crassostreae]|nr:hypothetical protein EDB46_107193 [Vibrio crassostreae]